MKRTKYLLMCMAASLYASTSFTQDLVLNLLSGETENYPTADIRSIKFPGNNMVITQHDGTLISMDIASISSYGFDLGLSANAGSAAVATVLKMYPNPASERVQIAYTGRESAVLTVEILDGSGRVVESLYSGSHSSETNLVWHPGAVARGTYLCRVIASDRVVSGKIIVQ